MSALDLDLIRTDGGTQSRVALSEETYLDYAEAMMAGAKFPPVVVYHDGATYWLADGFHRYFAVQEAGARQIDAEIRTGTKRDAVLFSLKANGTHGLIRTNADKRKAVETMMADAEWREWSDRKVAETIGVSVPFVSGLRRPEVKAKQQENRVASEKRQAEKRNPITPPVVRAPTTSAPTPKKEIEDTPYFGPSDEEIEEARAAAEADLTSLMALIEADDKMAALVEENKQLRAEVAVLKSTRDGYMNRCNEQIDRIKTLRRQLDKAKAAHA